ncbi:MAG: B12-binding domain-containing radical SAM protein, partial [Desulfobacterales bacterium]
MKILLIYPYWLENRTDIQDVIVPPIGLYYVGSVLKENHYDVEILNWSRINETPEDIEKILLEKKPDIIGFSVLQANRWGGIEIARIAKQIYPKVKIVFGGVTPTFLWEHFLTHFPEIDFVVIGEGEYTFLNLV